MMSIMDEMPISAFKPESVCIPFKNFYPVTAAVAEYIQCVIEGIEFETQFNNR